MQALEKIQRYITETNASTVDNKTYCMYVSEIRALYEMMCRDAYGAMCLIFDYGRAKGYRAAKAEAQRGQAD